MGGALDGVMGLRVGNGNNKRRRSKHGATSLVAHQEYVVLNSKFRVDLTEPTRCFQLPRRNPNHMAPHDDRLILVSRQEAVCSY